MSFQTAQIQTLLQNDPVLNKLSDSEKKEVADSIKQYLIPDTAVYRYIVWGVIAALLFSVVIIGWSVVEGSTSDTGLTAAIAIATGCFGGLIGALAPQKP